ncbi:MAG: hypothetical protein QOG98_910 [Pseudonocardiales bacterium]|nr:hypothetical protein [Pseudonocardiales bacterium]
MLLPTGCGQQAEGTTNSCVTSRQASLPTPRGWCRRWTRPRRERVTGCRIVESVQSAIQA